MKIITFAAQKGGVGKTTTAVNIALAAQAVGLKVVVFDLDMQESATSWYERRAELMPDTDEGLHVEFTTARRLPTGIASAEANGYDLVIVDTPPAAGPDAVEAVQAADLVLIPCRPSLIDLDAIKRTAQLLKTTKAKGFVLLNAAPPTAVTLIDEAQKFAETTGLAVAPAVLRERSSFRNSWPTGQGVIEYEPEGKAAAEIASLMKFISEELQIVIRSKHQNIKTSNLQKRRA